MQVYTQFAETPQLVATFSQKVAIDCASDRGRDFVNFYCNFPLSDRESAYFSPKQI
jgi:hypothetical protein